MTAIRARSLSRFYGRRVGIDGVELDVPAGARFGFLGPNGAGKTTTIRILLGFLRPGGGAARVLGRDCWRESHVIKRDVGYLPGDLRLYPWMTGRSALAIVGRVRGLDLRAAGADLADRLQMELTVRVRTMSRGMRQKLGLILALAHDPKVLILDEPTAGLDPIMQQVLEDILRERAARGTTVFFSSHTLSEVEKLCDRVAIVRRGRIVADAALTDLRERARRRVIIEFADRATAEAAAPPDGLAVQRRDGVRWEATLDGPSGPLCAWLASRGVHDVEIGPPDLEALFHSFYAEGAPA